jgi:hypothetical protein
MKKLLLLLSFSPILISSGHVEPIKDPKPPLIQHVKPQPKIIPHNPIHNLINALIYVESRGKTDAIGDTHLGSPSIGVLQIRPIMVREANRILKKLPNSKPFKLDDRFSRKKSINMFMVWKNYHHKNDSFEKIARCWNGGPKGYKNNSTLKYWVKVKKQLNK